MRAFWILATAATVITAVPADAQRAGRGGWSARSGASMPMRAMPTMNHARPAVPHVRPNMPHVRPGGQWQNQHQSQRQWQRSNSWSRSNTRVQINNRVGRWGNHIGGRWHGGVQAPGGWNAYHRPFRGYVVPSYWVAPSFFINDWSTWGLSTPPSGYTWSRYYDDAVLLDGHGRVYDSVSGIDWDRDTGSYDDGQYEHDDRYADRAEYDDYDDRDGPPVAPERRDNGVGGAVIGGVVGGIAGNAIAGRGNRLGGTLIGAGVGAIAGAAIDRAEDRGRDRRGYGAPYPAPGHRGDRYAPPPVAYAPPAEVVQDRHVVRGYDSRAYAAGPHTSVHYGPYGSTTTVTVVPAVTTTTTTTEFVYEDAPVRRKTYAKRAKATKLCRCR